MKQLFSGILMLLILTVPGLAAHAAGSATMDLDQDAYEVTRGELLEVGVLVDPHGESLDTARSVLTFDPNILRAQNVLLSGSFDRSAPGNYIDNERGKISWGAFTLDGGVTSQTSLITITFLALSAGDGGIQISSDSRAISNGEENIDVSALGEAEVTVAEAVDSEPGVALIAVESTTHLNEESWYPTSDVELSWTELEGESPLVSYAYSWGQDADEQPGIYLDAAVTQLSLEAEFDGVFYFKIKGVQEDGRETIVTRRLVRVDTTQPNPIELTVQDDKILEGESAWFTFATTDETSGVVEYQISINGQPFEPQTSPLEVTDMVAGTYFVRVAALDQAGNATYGGASVRVYPEGTDLSRPEGYEETGEVQAITASLGETVEEISENRTLLITVVLGALVLFGIIYSARKRRK